MNIEKLKAFQKVANGIRENKTWSDLSPDEKRAFIGPIESDVLEILRSGFRCGVSMARADDGHGNDPENTIANAWLNENGKMGEHLINALLTDKDLVS